MTNQSLQSDPTGRQFRIFTLFNPLVSLWTIANKGSNYAGVCCTDDLFPKVVILHKVKQKTFTALNIHELIHGFCYQDSIKI